MRRTCFALAFAAYLALYVLGVGAVHAQWTVDYTRILSSGRHCRSSLWFAYGWNAIPLAPLVAIIVTAGYADGFRYSCRRPPRRAPFPRAGEAVEGLAAPTIPMWRF